jgi:hypothetical protein
VPPSSSARHPPDGVVALLHLVQLSSERTLEPARKVCSFAEKQVSRPAQLSLVRSERLAGRDRDASLRRTAEVPEIHNMGTLVRRAG